MPIHLNSRLSLKVRLSWGVAAVVLLATFAIATVALHHVRQQLEKSITEDLFQRLSAISDAVDLKFQSRRTLLKTLSDSFESVPPGVPAQLQQYIEQIQSLRDLFDNVSVIDPDGNVVANLNGAVAFGSINVADREYFTESLRLSKGIISQPYKKVQRFATSHDDGAGVEQRWFAAVLALRRHQLERPAVSGWFAGREVWQHGIFVHSQYAGNHY